MKTAVIITILVLLGTSFPAWAGSDEQQLESLLHEFLAGASVNDFAAHERFWAEDLVYTSSTGLRFGKADILERMKAEPEPEQDTGSDAPETVYTAEEVRIRLYGDTAVVAFRLLGTPRPKDGKVQQYFNTGTFVKRDGLWRAVAWQATMIPGPGQSP